MVAWFETLIEDDAGEGGQLILQRQCEMLRSSFK